MVGRHLEEGRVAVLARGRSALETADMLEGNGKDGTSAGLWLVY